MKNKVFAVLTASAGLLMVSSAVFAHHSNAIVDKDKLITMTGTVTKFMFVNPHVYMHVDVKDSEGKTVDWYVAGQTVQILHGIGWTNKTFQPGEQLLLQGHQHRDGRPLLFWRAIYRCGSGEQIPNDPGIASEYRTHVKLVAVEPARVKAVCAGQATIAPQTATNLSASQ